MDKLAQLLVARDDSIREVMACIDRNASGIALVVDQDRRLIGTVTDGDIRRAILAGTDLDLPAQALVQHQLTAPHPAPFVAPVGTPDSQLLQMMSEYTLRHIPLLDEAGRVVDVALLSDLVKEFELPLRAVVMAGGFGTRLRPLTDDLPKPMLPVGDRPLLELIIDQLRQAGIRRVNLSTHFKREVIAHHFRDGQDFGVEIEYTNEDLPLGTAGSLGLLDVSEEPLLVINGDILTRVDFRAMLDFHSEHRADMTVAVRQFEFSIPYGVIETDGVAITGISEKPVVRYFVNAGIYLLNPEVRRYIPRNQHCDMTELIDRLPKEDGRVVGFPVREYWLDIGQAEDYDRAQADMAAGRF